MRIKRILSLAIAVIMVVSICSVGALAADNSFENFVETRAYIWGMFEDVSTHWSESYVAKAYCIGMIDGFEDSTFRPEDTLTVSGAIKLAACLNSIYRTGKQAFKNSDPWYKEYLDYCVEQGILANRYGDFDAPITRAHFAEIFAKCLPADALEAINIVEDNAIPDVQIAVGEANPIYTLYRAGILTGDAISYTYRPHENIRRSEVATLLARMMNPSERYHLTLEKLKSLSAKEASEKYGAALFRIEAIDVQGHVYNIGTGVFINSDGTALTNYSAIEGASSVRVIDSYGTTHHVEGVYDYDAGTDLAKIKVGYGGFTAIPVGDIAFQEVGRRAGTLIYAGAWSVQAKESEITEITPTYLKSAAEIPADSAGGILVDECGRLLGLYANPYITGQEGFMNTVIPVYYQEKLGTTELKRLNELFPAPEAKKYDKHWLVPDFGAFAGVETYYSEAFENGDGYLYKISEINGNIEEVDLAYYDLLWKSGFYYIESTYEDGVLYDICTNGDGSILVLTTMDIYDEDGDYYMVMVIKE